jgi:hypothetical protein
MFALRYSNTHGPRLACLMFGLYRLDIDKTMMIDHQHPVGL